MKCTKCGTSLHPEQKVCLACGTATKNWDGGATREEAPQREIPWTAIGVIGGGLLVAIVLLVVAMSMRIAPPDQVTEKWMKAVTGRQFQQAYKYTTEEFEAGQMDRPRSNEMSDKFFQFMYDYKADYTISEPKYNSPKNPTSAEVNILLNGENGEKMEQGLKLEKQGKEWKIAELVY